MKLPALILCLSALLSSAAVSAKDIDDRFAVFGVGAQPCSDFTKARSSGGVAETAYLDWISGYLSAFNLIVPKTYNILGDREFTEALGWLDQHCATQAEENFANALAKLTEALYPERSSFSPERTGRKMNPKKQKPGQ